MNDQPSLQPWTKWIEIVLIFCIILIHVGWLVPHVNEAHYLTKAKYYWNHEWCQGDFFLQSVDAHHTFYWSFGWLTLFLPLPWVALVGRLIAWGLLSFAWQRLSWSIAPRSWLSVITAGLFVAINTHFHMAGEWLFGGVEAKVIAYALVIISLADLLQNRWNRALLWIGAASAFHVLVGGWSIVCLAISWLAVKQDRPKLISLWPGIVGGFLLSLPGLLPALMLTSGVDAEIVSEATRIYVFERLSHHLLITQFKTAFIFRFSVAVIIFVGMFLIVRRELPLRRFGWFVLGSLAIGIVGIAITYATQNNDLLAAKWLRYYWYRLADVMVALGIAVFGGWFYSRWFAEKRNYRLLFYSLGVSLTIWHLTAAVMKNDRAYPPAETPKKIGNYDDWTDVCRWIRESGKIQQDAIFLTPRSNHTFKWHTNRNEVVTWKDIPQDAASIVGWYQRMKQVHRPLPGSKRKFCRSLISNGQAYLVQQGRQYNAQYALTRRNTKQSQSITLPIIYQNKTFMIYQLFEEEKPTD